MSAKDRIKKQMIEKAISDQKSKPRQSAAPVKVTDIMKRVSPIEKIAPVITSMQLSKEAEDALRNKQGKFEVATGIGKSKIAKFATHYNEINSTERRYNVPGINFNF